MDKLPYRLLTGPDTREFCEKVSAALNDGYVLYGSPALTVADGKVVCAQAVILPEVPFDPFGGGGITEV
jgi:hypothetical protein